MDFLEENVPLAPLTNMKIGGAAKYFAKVSTKAQWGQLTDWVQKTGERMILLGGGNNLIFPDEGMDCLVVRLMNDQVSFGEDRLVTVGSGVPIGNLIAVTRKSECFGLEGFVGIPGNFGACVRGNIGIPDCEMMDFIVDVEVWHEDRFETWTNEECEFEYRTSKIKKDLVLVWSARLQLLDKPTVDVDEQMMKRLAKQPKGKTCGSFFMNPDWRGGIYSGKVIEDLGLKGHRIGGAVVSKKHGNWIINEGSATAADVIQLARLVKKRAMEEQGIDLVSEVMIYNSSGGLVTL
jgi:UDP-N-acetylenolpyruvoylglucosamine reductase